MAEEKTAKVPQKNDFKLFDDTTVPVSTFGSFVALFFLVTKYNNTKKCLSIVGKNVGCVLLCLIFLFIFIANVIQPPSILENLVAPFAQTANTEESIIEILKYSQKDIDAAIAKVQAEVRPAHCYVTDDH